MASSAADSNSIQEFDATPVHWLNLTEALRLTDDRTKRLDLYQATFQAEVCEAEICKVSHLGICDQLIADALPQDTPEWLLRLAQRIVRVNCSRKSSREMLLAMARGNRNAERLLHAALQQDWPTCIMFTSSDRHPVSTVDFPCAQYPPATPSYSVFFWIRLTQCHKGDCPTILSIGTASSSLLQIAIGADACRVTIDGQVTRFDCTMHVDKWHSVALVHGPRRTEALDPPLTLYIDALKVSKSQLVPWPRRARPSQELFATLGTSNGGTRVASFALSRCFVVAQALNNSLLDIYQNLGHRYNANMQGTLSTFMTYQASTAINIKMERDGPVIPLKLRNHENMPESLILFSMIPSIAQDFAMQEAEDCFELYNQNGPSVKSGKHVKRLTGARRNVDIIHARSFSHDLYQIGGIGLLLYLIGTASDSNLFLSFVKLLFMSINSSWRNSETIERIHGYEILAHIIRTSSHDYVTSELLATVLNFVGVSEQVIRNPLAYRNLVLNLQIWSKGSGMIRISLLNQFQIIFTAEETASYNCRRLGKMQALKKVTSTYNQAKLDSPEVSSHLTGALKVLLEEGTSTESIRTIATCIVTALDKEDGSGHGFAHSLLEMFTDYLCDAQQPERLSKFASSVTTRWIFLLLSRATTQKAAFRILTFLLVSQGPQFVSRFADKNNGFDLCFALVTNLEDFDWGNLLRIAFGSIDIDTNAISDSGLTVEGCKELLNPQALSLWVSFLKSKLLAITVFRGDSANSAGQSPSALLADVTSHATRNASACQADVEELSVAITNLIEWHNELPYMLKALKGASYPFGKPVNLAPGPC